MKTGFLSFLVSVFLTNTVLAETIARTWEMQNIKVACLDLGPNIANCYVVSSPDRDAYVIDPGGNASGIVAYLKANQLNVLGYLITHGHNDHIKGLPQAKQIVSAPAGIHSLDVPLYRKRMGNDGPFSFFLEKARVMVRIILHSP